MNALHRGTDRDLFLNGSRDRFALSQLRNGFYKNSGEDFGRDRDHVALIPSLSRDG
jgi:hypothetical protein